MKHFYSSKFLALSCASAVIGSLGAVSAASATGPVLVAVGNGAPLAGSSDSKIGVGILTPKVNGTPTSVRVLGKEKTAGIYTSKITGSNGQPTQAQIMTPVDGIVNSRLPK